jgi:hypothetical protein
LKRNQPHQKTLRKRRALRGAHTNPSTPGWIVRQLLNDLLGGCSKL